MIMSPANDVARFPQKPVTTIQTDNDRNAEHHIQNFHHSENLKCHTLKRFYVLFLYYSFLQSDYITKIIPAVGSH